MAFYDSDKHLIPIMMQLIAENVGEKTYDFELARECSRHAVRMSHIGECFSSDAFSFIGVPENVLSEIIFDGDFVGTAEKIVERLLSSPKHRNKIEQYPIIGIGTSVGYGLCGETRLYVVQRFRC
ncbi:hypothetical protein KY343_00830 [Candidatus Woesearchaeota archaeon]|nr:hypothetical protein [Candidatus Woesearchaeota archaeon]